MSRSKHNGETATFRAKVIQGGRITIDRRVRERLGIAEGDELLVKVRKVTIQEEI